MNEKTAKTVRDFRMAVGVPTFDLARTMEEKLLAALFELRGVATLDEDAVAKLTRHGEPEGSPGERAMEMLRAWVRFREAVPSPRKLSIAVVRETASEASLACEALEKMGHRARPFTRGVYKDSDLRAVFDLIDVDAALAPTAKRNLGAKLSIAVLRRTIREASLVCAALEAAGHEAHPFGWSDPEKNRSLDGLLFDVVDAPAGSDASGKEGCRRWMLTEIRAHLRRHAVEEPTESASTSAECASEATRSDHLDPLASAPETGKTGKTNAARDLAEAGEHFRMAAKRAEAAPEQNDIAVGTKVRITRFGPLWGFPVPSQHRRTGIVVDTDIGHDGTRRWKADVFVFPLGTCRSWVEEVERIDPSAPDLFDPYPSHPPLDPSTPGLPLDPSTPALTTRLLHDDFALTLEEQTCILDALGCIDRQTNARGHEHAVRDDVETILQHIGDLQHDAIRWQEQSKIRGNAAQFVVDDVEPGESQRQPGQSVKPWIVTRYAPDTIRIEHEAPFDAPPGGAAVCLSDHDAAHVARALRGEIEIERVFVSVSPTRLGLRAGRTFYDVHEPKSLAARIEEALGELWGRDTTDDPRAPAVDLDPKDVDPKRTISDGDTVRIKGTSHPDERIFAVGRIEHTIDGLSALLVWTDVHDGVGTKLVPVAALEVVS